MFKRIDSLHFWCNKILPLVYDDSLSYYETLCKLSAKLNEVINDVNGIPEYIEELLSEEKLKGILSTLLNQLEEQIASANEEDSKTATADRNVGDMVWLNGLLYRAIKQIDNGDKYVVDSNIEKITIEELFDDIQLTFCDYVEVSSTNASKNINNGTWFWYKNKLCLATKDISQGTSFVDGTNYIEINVGDILNEETNAREQADSVLEDKINNETSAREEADTILQQNINNETNAREEAVTLLQQNINNETNAREVADTLLQQNINNETNAREVADSELEDKINNVSKYDKADIRNYGGIGDGLTDNTTAFNNCMAENNVVYFPNYDGNNGYVLGSVILDSGCEVKGDHGVKLLFNGTNYLFTLTGSNIKVSDLFIQCSNAGIIFNLVATSAMEYIYLTNIQSKGANTLITDINSTANITNIYLTRLTSRDHKGSGVVFKHCIAFVFLTDVTIDFVGNVGNSRAFDFTNNSGMHLVHCEAEGGASDGSHIKHMGFVFTNCQAVWLERCMADTLDSSGFYLNGDANQYFYFANCVSSLCMSHGFLLNGLNIQMVNCVTNGRNGLEVTLTGAHGIYNFASNVAITNALMYNATGYGLVYASGTELNFGNSNITSNKLNAIFVEASANGIIHDCIINGNGSDTVGGATTHVKYFNLWNGNALLNN